MNHESRLWGFSRDREGAESMLKDINERNLILGNVSRDHRLVQEGDLWVIREHPPFFDEGKS